MAKRHSSIDPIFDENNTSNVKSYIIMGCLLILIGFVIYAAFSGGDDSAGPVPVVQADNTPWTRAPEDTGGMEIPNQDSTVFELMRDDETLEADMMEIQESGDDIVKDEAESLKDVDSIVDKLTDNEIKEDEKDKKDDPIGALIEEKVTIPEVVTPEVDKPAPIPTLKTEEARNVILRLGAVQSSDMEVARQEFARLQNLSDGALAGFSPNFETVSLPEKGDFVRINISVDADKADALCKTLLASGAPCLVIK